MSFKENLSKRYLNDYYFTDLYPVEMADMDVFLSLQFFSDCTHNGFR